MTLTDDRLPAATAGVRDRIEAMVRGGELRAIEILWPDHWGHPRGKRIPAEKFLEHADGDGFAFCDAVLSYGVTGEAQDGTLLTGWETGYPTCTRYPISKAFACCPGDLEPGWCCATSSTPRARCSDGTSNRVAPCCRAARSDWFPGTRRGRARTARTQQPGRAAHRRSAVLLAGEARRA